MPTIEWKGSPNYNSGRSGRKPIAIVDHTTAGSYPGCLEWLRNPAAQASAHYLVTKAGVIYQLVKDEDTAWANGIVNKPNWKLYDGTNPNKYTISIEHEGQPGEGLTELQYQSSLWLHRQIMQRWGIPADNDHIIGHYRIDSVDRPNCPGSGFPWDRLFKDLKGVDNVDKVVVYFSPADYSVALAVANKNGGCAMFCRNGKTGVHPDALKAVTKINIGGPELGCNGEIYLSGTGALDTLVAVGNAYKAGKV
ncbi:MAG: N-acetylmuramoyl-L-alanine amidase [Desulfitobacteriaceae bacterium]